jgi:hypothetical protein
MRTANVGKNGRQGRPIGHIDGYRCRAHPTGLEFLFQFSRLRVLCSTAAQEDKVIGACFG